MDPLEPAARRADDLVSIAADEAEPSRREVNPVGLQIPVPQTFAVVASARATGGARDGAFVTHAWRLETPLDFSAPARQVLMGKLLNQCTRCHTSAHVVETERQHHVQD